MQIPFQTKAHPRRSKSKAIYIISEEKYIYQATQDFPLSESTLASISSEGTGANHSHHHYVADGCQHSNPQPNGVTGHFPIILCFWGSRVASVEVGGGRLQGRVAIVWRIHEGPAHSREMLSGERKRNSVNVTNIFTSPSVWTHQVFLVSKS